jgi:hypothetical protein
MQAMHPSTHILLSWLMADSDGLDRRGRMVVTLSGAVADLDGLGVVAEIATRNTSHPLLWWSNYHHTFGHNLLFGLACATAAYFYARRSLRAGLLALSAFHVHLLCDIAGARGPDGDSWPIPYLAPISRSLELTWSGQWALNAWPNFVITGAAMLLSLYFAWKRGYSPVGLISAKADAAFVTTLRNRVAGTLGAIKNEGRAPKDAP